MDRKIKKTLLESGEWMTTEQLHEAIGLHVERQKLSRRLAALACKDHVLRIWGDLKKGIPHKFKFNPAFPIRNLSNQPDSLPETDKVGSCKQQELGKYPFETYMVCGARWTA